MMNEMRHVHKLTIILYVFQGIKASAWSLIVLFFLGAGSDLNQLLNLPFTSLQLTLIILGVFLLVLIVFSWLRWYRMTYQLVNDSITIKHGVFIRHDRTIHKRRIHSINFTQSIFHQVFNLTEVQIETAGSDLEVDAVLKAIPYQEAVALKEKFLNLTNTHLVEEEFPIDGEVEAVDEEQVEEEQPFIKEKKISIYHLLIAGATTGRVGAIFGIVFLLLSEIDNFLSEGDYERVVDWVSAQSIVAYFSLVFLYLLIVIIIGMIGYVNRYGRFSITREGEMLYIERGLIEKKSLSIPVSRIQAVLFKQNLFRMPFSLGAVSVELAGGEKDDKEAMQTVIFPLLRKKEWANFLKELLPEYQEDLSEMNHIPRKSFTFKALRMTIIYFVGIGVVHYFYSELVLVKLGVYLFALMGLYLLHRIPAFRRSGEQLVMQYFQVVMLSKEVAIVKKKDIQALETQGSRLARLLKLGYLNLSIMNNFLGRQFTLGFLSEEQLEEISEWYISGHHD